MTSILLLTLDLVGTFAFAISGATAGVRKQLDLFGVLVLSFAAATAGGIARDLAIGATPPPALADWRYLAVSMVAGLAGVPWFAGFAGGPAYLLAPSFGFIVGFIAAAAVAGWFAERAWDRKPLLAMAGFCLATVTPFLVGVPYMAAVLGLSDPATIAAYGITPFIVPGLIKAGLAAAAFPLVWRLIRAVDERR